MNSQVIKGKVEKKFPQNEQERQVYRKDIIKSSR